MNLIIDIRITANNQRPKTTGQKNERQATLAIACLYLNLSHLVKGGQVRAGV